MEAAFVHRIILLFRKNNLERIIIALVNAWQYQEKDRRVNGELHAIDILFPRAPWAAVAVVSIEMLWFQGSEHPLQLSWLLRFGYYVGGTSVEL